MTSGKPDFLEIDQGTIIRELVILRFLIYLHIFRLLCIHTMHSCMMMIGLFNLSLTPTQSTTDLFGCWQSKECRLKSNTTLVQSESVTDVADVRTQRLEIFWDEPNRPYRVPDKSLALDVEIKLIRYEKRTKGQ